METLLLSASCQEGIFTAVNLVGEKVTFSTLVVILFLSFVISTVLNCFVELMSFKY